MWNGFFRCDVRSFGVRVISISALRIFFVGFPHMTHQGRLDPPGPHSKPPPPPWPWPDDPHPPTVVQSVASSALEEPIDSVASDRGQAAIAQAVEAPVLGSVGGTFLHGVPARGWFHEEDPPCVVLKQWTRQARAPHVVRDTSRSRDLDRVRT